MQPAQNACRSLRESPSTLPGLVAGFSVGVASLDRQHRGGWTLPGLRRSPRKGKISSAILPILEQMRRYAPGISAPREALLAEQGYPGLDAQSWEHQAYSDALAEFIFSASLKILDPDSVGQFLTDWWAGAHLDIRYGYKEVPGRGRTPEPEHPAAPT